MKINSRRRVFAGVLRPYVFAIGLISIVSAGAEAQTTNTFPASGDAGIGTTSPSFPLTIVKNHNGPTSVAIFNTTDGTIAQAGVGVSRTMDWSGKYISFGLTAPSYSGAGYGETAYFHSAGLPLKFGSNTNNDIFFFTNGISNTRMTITGAGSVGIGTSSPSYSFDVNGGVNSFRAKAATTSSSDVIATFENASGIQAIVRGNGNIGMGTTNPGGKLHVYGTSGNDMFVGAYGNTLNFLYDNTGDDVSGWVNYVGYQGGTTKFRDFSIGNGKNAAIAFFDGSSANVGIGTTTPASGYKLDVNGNTNVTGNLNVTGNINAKYQDVAEWVPSSEQLAAGTVVVLDTTKSNQVIASTAAYDTRVAGVISAQPGITLGESGEGKVLVATTGRVRVKVDASRGAIQIGDLLVTSDVAGVAMKSEAVEFAGRKMHMPGTIIGKALEPMAKGKGEILVLLSLQ